MEFEQIFGLTNSSLSLPKLDPYLFEYKQENKSVYVLPTLHNQVEFSKISQLTIQTKKIDKILVELPIELKFDLIEAIKRLPLVSVLINELVESQGNLIKTPHASNAYIVHPGETMFWSCYIGQRNDISFDFIDYWHPHAFQSLYIPIDYTGLASIGWTEFWKQIPRVLVLHLENKIHKNRSLMMIETIDQKLTNYGDNNCLIICGAAHWPAIDYLLQVKKYLPPQNNPIPSKFHENYIGSQIEEWKEKIPNWKLADIHPHTLHLVTTEFPFFLGKFVEEPMSYSPLEHIRELFFEAEEKYKHQFDDQVSPANYRRLFQYLRNLGRLQGITLPDLNNLITAAKGMIDDDYAFEVFRTAISYPFLPNDKEKLDITIKFTPDESQGEVIRFAFKRRFRRPVLKKYEGDKFDDLDPIPEEEWVGQWEEIWQKHSRFGYVSYPPEDEYIENYMQFLRQRIIEILMEEESSSLEFEASLEDGIDWRETVRNFHKRKIYVKKYPKNKYKVGALIVQFLEEPFDEAEYNYHSTLFAEHDQESHISVITTTPGLLLVGPGITRVKYAAIISQFPPLGLSYLIEKTNVDLKLRLIWTAINMSLNNIIGFVAKKPPTPAQRHFAAERGFRLVFLPMGQLTQASLHRLRTMHLLAHRDLRDQAREYIGF